MVKGKDVSNTLGYSVYSYPSLISNSIDNTVSFQYVYFTSSSQTGVYKINTLDMGFEFLSTSALGFYSTVELTGRYLYGGDSYGTSGDFYKVDTSTGATTTLTIAGASQHAAIVSGDDNYVYFGDRGNSTIWKVSTDSFKVVNKYDFSTYGINIFALNLSPDGTKIYGNIDPNAWIAVDTQDMTLITEISLDSGAHYYGQAVSPDGRYVYLSSGNSSIGGSFVIIDTLNGYSHTVSGPTSYGSYSILGGTDINATLDGRYILQDFGSDGAMIWDLHESKIVNWINTTFDTEEFHGNLMDTDGVHAYIAAPSMNSSIGAKIYKINLQSGKIEASTQPLPNFTATSGNAAFNISGQLPINFNYQAAYRNINLPNSNLRAYAPSTPTSTTSSTAVMMGLGSTISFTCGFSGKVLVRIRLGALYDTTGGAPIQFLYGTGTAPANGAAVSGTAISPSEQLRAAGAGTSLSSAIPWSYEAILSGLEIGTPYWFDVALTSNGTNTFTVENVVCTITEC